ncbi:hypothetical protein A3H15_01950 [Candidatus Kaiserbacteria bacterium RIFCSPLOWO2_12_FULL_50_28]|nr:MAG: hypothetical protein A3H15_01950 [Candidatus Kaiserbacteria bacterium RIFCSPLOWO2_12_FULL_50_28]
MKNGPVAISITGGTVVMAVLILVAAWLIFELRDLVLVLLTAIVLASAIEPAVTALGRHKVPRVPAILLVYFLLFGSFFGIFYFFVPTLFGELTTLISSLPAYLDTFNQWGAFDDYARIFGVQNVPAISTSSLMESMREFLGAAGMFGNAFSAVANIFGGILSFILIVVFSFYFTVIRNGIDDFLSVITPHKYQKYILDLGDRSRNKIGLWMQGQLLLAVIVGVLVFLGLTILGVKHALLLAVVAAMFEIIPVFGPILAAVPAVALSFLDGGLTLGLLVIALYVIVQQFESHLIHPLVVTRVVGVPPLLVILSIIVGAQLAGFLGILLSVPIAATIQELVKDVKTGRFLAINSGDE